MSAANSKTTGAASSRRALHWVFKVADREATIDFYRAVLGMAVLRHEEFKEGCAAACNGRYDGQWSKTMMGYGAEDSHFVVELTYNYGVKSYELGDEFRCLRIKSKAAVAAAKQRGLASTDINGGIRVAAPDGYPVELVDEDIAGDADPCQGVSINVKELGPSLEYWQTLLGMKLVEKTDDAATLRYGEDQASLRLHAAGTAVSPGTATGRIAFSCPEEEVAVIEKSAKESGNTIHTPLVVLPTPGKADVRVVILQDPDGHEICFVGDTAFRELSATDPAADALLSEAMTKDESKEYFAKREAKRRKLAAKEEAQ